MSLMKIALTVLGTIGLTAGTVLAVAEPTPSCLPEAAAKAGACSGCPTNTCGTAKCTSAVSACTKGDSSCPKTCSKDGECPNRSISAAGPLADGLSAAVHHVAAFLDDAADSAARSGTTDLNRCEFVAVAAQSPPCESGKCTSAVSACAKPAAACAKSCDEKNVCQSDSANTIGGPLDPGVIERVAATCCEVKAACAASECSSAKSACCTAACESKTGCPTAKKTKKLTLSLGFSSNGPIIRLASGETPAPCAEKACDGLTACPCPAGTCQKENCDACPCEGKCEQTHHVTVTACEAKAACAAQTSTCNATACETSACAAGICKAPSCSSCPEGCEKRDTIAEDADCSDSASAVAACDCKDCCCEKCDCTTDTSCPPGEICPVAVRLHGFQTAGILSNGIRLMTTGIAPPTGEAACRGDGCRNYDSYRMADAAEQPGRVRMTHLPGMPILPPGTQFQPSGFVSLWPQSLGAAFPMMACGAEFESPKTWPALRSASYAESASDAPEPARHPAAGTWARDIDGTKITFTIERGRLRGTAAGIVRFSGTCSISGDGQVFGLLDEVDLEEKKDGATLTAATRLVDQPFAFRFSVDGGDLIVKDFRCGGMDAEIRAGENKIKLVDYVSIFSCGRFERSE